MLHNEARNLLVEAYEQTHDAQTVAKCFQVSTSTVYRFERANEENWQCRSSKPPMRKKAGTDRGRLAGH